MRRCGPAHRLKLSPTGDREPHGSVPVHHPVRRCRGFATCAARAALIVGCICSFAGPAARGQAPDRPRVITLSPSATELIYAAGAGADLVGTDRYSTYPPAARSLPRVGDAMQVNDEAILALRPTLVVGWQPSGDTAALATLLAGLHIPLVYANPRNLDDIPKLIRDLGKRLGTSGAANAAAHRLEQRIAALQAPAGPPRTVFIEVSADPLYTLGGDPLINDLLARCGGRNPYAGSRIAAPQVSVESVLRLDPDVVIMSPHGGDTLSVRRTWWARHGLRAARDGRFYAIDPDWLHRPGPRLIDAAEAVCRDMGGGNQTTGRPQVMQRSDQRPAARTGQARESPVAAPVQLPP
ncbi:Vitamin B12-binding protein [Castellaniella defragrans]